MNKAFMQSKFVIMDPEKVLLLMTFFLVDSKKMYLALVKVMMAAFGLWS